MMLAVMVSTVDYRALARAWPLHAVLAWGLVLPTLVLHNVHAGFIVIATMRAVLPITAGTASAA